MQQHHTSRRGLICPVSIDQLESRTFLSATTTALVQEPITIGSPTFKDITFVATSGRKTTISVTGATAAITFPGAAALTFYQGHAFFPAGQVETVSSIVITNAIPGKASLKVTCAFGAGTFNIGSITGGNLGSIVAPDANLTSSMNLMSINRLTLAKVSANMNLGSSANYIGIKGTLGGSLTVGSIGTLKAGELVKEKITTTAVFSRSKLDINLLDGGSGIEQSTISSAGNIGTVKAGFIQSSIIAAAAKTPASSTDVPEDPSVFTSQAIIKSVQIPSGKTTGFFANSVITAATIGVMQLGELSGGGGVAANKFGGFGATGPTGQLDRVAFQLGASDLSKVSKLRAALTALGITYTSGAGLPNNTVFYNFNLNILS